MVLDASTGPGDRGDLALAPQEPITGDPTLLRDAEGDGHAVGQEHQAALGSKESSGLRQPRARLAPWSGAILADGEVEAGTAQPHPTRVGFHQREDHAVAALTSPGRVELGTAQVDADGVGTGASEGGGQERRAATELDHVEALDVAEEPELRFRLAEQPPPDPPRRPLDFGFGVRELRVHERPQVAVTDKVCWLPVHATIVAHGSPVTSRHRCRPRRAARTGDCRRSPPLGRRAASAADGGCRRVTGPASLAWTTAARHLAGTPRAVPMESPGTARRRAGARAPTRSPGCGR